MKESDSNKGIKYCMCVSPHLCKTVIAWILIDKLKLSYDVLFKHVPESTIVRASIWVMKWTYPHPQNRSVRPCTFNLCMIPISSEGKLKDSNPGPVSSHPSVINTNSDNSFMIEPIKCAVYGPNTTNLPLVGPWPRPLILNCLKGCSIVNCKSL